MKRAGYRLVETRDLVPGYLFGVFQVREPETDESPALSASDH
jgi:hypothetical protein